MRRLSILFVTLPLLVPIAGLATAPAASAPASAAKAAKKPTIKLTARKSVIEKGKKVKFSGRVRPAKGTKGDTVVIKKRTKKGWKVEGRTTVKKKGKFAFTDKPTTATSRSYKAVLKRTKKHRKATSAKVDVAVATWRDMDGLDDQVATSSRMHPVVVKSNGTLYEHSLRSSWYGEDAEGWLELNLYGKCFKMRSRVALGDSSATGASAHFTLHNDGTSVYENDVAELFTSKPANISLTGVKRLRFEASRLDPTINTQAAFLSPTLLCTT